MLIFWSVFYHKWCWILSKAFCASIEMIIWFLSFKLLIWCITLIDLWILKNPCIPGINPTWSWYMSFLMCCWILFGRILLRSFAFMFISDAAAAKSSDSSRLPWTAAYQAPPSTGFSRQEFWNGVPLPSLWYWPVFFFCVCCLGLVLVSG